MKRAKKDKVKMGDGANAPGKLGQHFFTMRDGETYEKASERFDAVMALIGFEWVPNGGAK